MLTFVFIAGPEAQFLFALKGEVRRLSLEGQHYNIIKNQLMENLQAVECDSETDDIYWADGHKVSEVSFQIGYKNSV